MELSFLLIILDLFLGTSIHISAELTEGAGIGYMLVRKRHWAWCLDQLTGQMVVGTIMELPKTPDCDTLYKLSLLTGEEGYKLECKGGYCWCTDLSTQDLVGETVQPDHKGKPDCDKIYASKEEARRPYKLSCENNKCECVNRKTGEPVRGMWDSSPIPQCDFVFGWQ